MANKPMTPKQARLFNHIQDVRAMNGYSPTIREMARHFKLSVTLIHVMLRTMERNGWMKIKSGAERGATPVFPKSRAPQGRKK